MDVIQRHEFAGPLKDAAIDKRLGEWTRLLNSAVIKTCAEIGLKACSKQNPFSDLPVSRQEYLSLDLMAFENNSKFDREKHDWRFPSAVFELENSQDPRKVAYSLWKVLCTWGKLKVVFCYKSDWEQARNLISYLNENVIKAVPLEGKDSLNNCFIIVGSKDQKDTFPYGFFKRWFLDHDTMRLKKN